MKMLNKSMETVKVDDKKVFKFYMLPILVGDKIINLTGQSMKDFIL